MNNPILIGQAEEIDLIQPQVRAMLEAPGFYIGGDSNNPEMNVPLVSNKRRVFNEYNALKRQKRALLASKRRGRSVNPLVGETPKETVQNVAEAMSALLVLMAPQHSDLCRLMSPLLAALETVANDGD